MSTELKPVECLTGEVTMTRYYGGQEAQPAVQLTFKRPDNLYGEKNVNFSNECGWWFLNLNKKQALEMAAALIEFANDTREEVE